MAKTVMEIYEIEKIQSFRRLGVTVECITAYGKFSYILCICINIILISSSVPIHAI